MEPDVTSDVRRLVIVLATLMVAFGGFLLWRGLGLVNDLEDLNNDVANLSAAYESAREDDPTLPPAEEVIDEPAPRDGIDGRDGRDGRDGVDGRDGQSPPCLLLITRCVGATGPPGRPPTDAEVYAQVLAYLTANPPPPGEDGADGSDSTVPGPQGPQGPGPTDEQIAAAVERYCSAHDNCRGPAGPPGPAGPRCDPGETRVRVKIQGDDFLLCKAA